MNPWLAFAVGVLVGIVFSHVRLVLIERRHQRDIARIGEPDGDV